MRTEQEYIEAADDAMEKKAPFSAVYYAFMALIMVFREIRDELVRHRTVYAPFIYEEDSLDPPYIVTCSDSDFTSPFCPFCAETLNTARQCTNSDCSKGNIGSIGDEPV